MFVLEAELQDCKKLLKRDPRAHPGIGVVTSELLEGISIFYTTIQCESHDASANNVRHKFDKVLEGKKTKKLKRGYTNPCGCVSAYHDISAVTG